MLGDLSVLLLVLLPARTPLRLPARCCGRGGRYCCFLIESVVTAGVGVKNSFRLLLSPCHLYRHRSGNSNSTVDPGEYVIVLGLKFDGAPKTHVR